MSEPTGAQRLSMDYVFRAAFDLVTAARASGIDLTIEHAPDPTKPLAMGNHIPIIHVRVSRDARRPVETHSESKT